LSNIGYLVTELEPNDALLQKYTEGVVLIW
jgi:hypothetical protein